MLHRSHPCDQSREQNCASNASTAAVAAEAWPEHDFSIAGTGVRCQVTV
jgi:hypothetical protein